MVGYGLFRGLRGPFDRGTVRNDRRIEQAHPIQCIAQVVGHPWVVRRLSIVVCSLCVLFRSVGFGTFMQRPLLQRPGAQKLWGW